MESFGRHAFFPTRTLSGRRRTEEQWGRNVPIECSRSLGTPTNPSPQKNNFAWCLWDEMYGRRPWRSREGRTHLWRHQGVPLSVSADVYVLRRRWLMCYPEGKPKGPIGMGKYASVPYGVVGRATLQSSDPVFCYNHYSNCRFFYICI